MNCSCIIQIPSCPDDSILIEPSFFGLGFALKQSLGEDEPGGALNEYHWGGMAGTHSWMSPTQNITGFCLTQRMPGFWHPFSHEFKALCYKITE